MGKDTGKAKCGSCQKTVSDIEGVQCEVCDRWFHCKCQSVSDSTYRAMSECKGIHWFCTMCNEGAEKLLPLLTRIQDKITLMESCIDGCKKMSEQNQEEIRKLNVLLEEKVLEMQKDMESKIEESNKNSKVDMTQVEPTWAERVSREVDSRFDQVKEEVRKVTTTVEETRVKAEELKDREAQVNNIVIYNLEELRTENKEEWFKNEKSQYLKLFNTIIGADVVEADVAKTMRLGPKDKSTKRPLLIQFKQRSTKNAVMERLSKLSKAPTPFNKVGVSHDLTRAEREECKKLVQLARQQEDEDKSGEWIYRVRGLPGQLAVTKMKAKRSKEE